MFISPTALDQLRLDNENYLPDKLVLMNRTDTLDEYGTPTKVYSTVGTYACGLAFSPFKFRSRETGGLGEATSEILVRARVLMEVASLVSPDDIVVLVEKYGEPVVPTQTYQVEGFPEIVPTGAILNLRRSEL